MYEEVAYYRSVPFTVLEVSRSGIPANRNRSGAILAMPWAIR
jgi:hypothetical protein